jgi:hypothetical protein
MRVRIIFSLLACTLLLVYCGCTKDPEIISKEERFVVVIVVDGPRYTETWGFPGRTFIPHRAAMLQEGALCAKMYNDGYCFTNAGHTAITTGVYQNISNVGAELPDKPSFFQYWLKGENRKSSEAWIITTKDKLEVLADCKDPKWNQRYRPWTDCGNSGLGSGYRQDSLTHLRVINALANYHPKLMLVNFKQPDASGHSGDSLAYLNGILETDYYVKKIWEKIQSDPYYKDRTTMLVTNDHGRHTAGHLDGFISHTDNCDGCKHIELFAMGPDIKKNHTSNEVYSQVDICQTVAKLMRIDMPTASGKPILDIFKDNKIPD